MSHLLASLPHLLTSAASFVVVLGVLVFIHELGHYVAARALGVQVLAFAIGFGRPLTSWTDRHGTVWKLCVLPLGGYVRMRSGAGEDDGLAPEQITGLGLLDSGPGVRALVASAGPAANFLLASVLYAALFLSMGREILLPVVGEVMEHSAAAEAGLRKGDTILSIDGAAISRFTDLRAKVAASPDLPISLTLRRDGAQLVVSVRPHPAQEGGHTIGRLGIHPGAVGYEKMAPAAAVLAGFTQTYDVLGDMLGGLGRLLSRGEGAEDLGGPIRIAQLSGEVAALGLASLISFMAVLSVNLGMVNLLPIPVLDGGHLMFCLAEALRGKPLPAKAQEYGYQVGFAIIASVFVLISWNDLRHVGLFRWVASVFS